MVKHGPIEVEQPAFLYLPSRDLETANRDLARLIEAIKAGVPGASVRDEIAALEDRRTRIEQRSEEAPAPLPRLHPNLAEIYRLKVTNLAEALADDDCREDAAAAIRSLIDEVRLVPESGELKIELFGELGALFAPANEHPRSKETGVQVTLVAGARYHLDLLLFAAAMPPCVRRNHR